MPFQASLPLALIQSEGPVCSRQSQDYLAHSGPFRAYVLDREEFTPPTPDYASDNIRAFPADKGLSPLSDQPSLLQKRFWLPALSL